MPCNETLPLGHWFAEQRTPEIDAAYAEWAKETDLVLGARPRWADPEKDLGRWLRRLYKALGPARGRLRQRLGLEGGFITEKVTGAEGGSREALP